MYEDIVLNFKKYTDDEFVFLNDRAKVRIEDFVDLFEGCELTYESLISRDKGVLGYASFFGELKEEGILT